MTFSRLWLYAAALACPLAMAQTPPAVSHITAVTLYPGSASIERTAQVAAGSRSFRFHCLPARLDAHNLQVTADANIRIGDVAVQVRERLLQDECASPMDARVHAAQERLAAAQVETEALELAQSYLQNIAGQSTDNGSKAHNPLPGSSQISAQAQSLRQAARDTLTSLHQARQQQRRLERELLALTAERDHSAAPQDRIATVTVTLAAERAGKVRLRYQVKGPSWSPGYRASLNSNTATVRLERLALVAQHTGEDWNNIPLLLSTGQPLAQTQGRLPSPWRVEVRPDVTERLQDQSAKRASARASMDTPVLAMENLSAVAAPSLPAPTFDVAITDSAYATEFSVPQRITVPSGGQRVTLALGEHNMLVQLMTRTAPAIASSAWLVAQLPELEGIWPAGQVALYRDGAFVGQGRFDPQQAHSTRDGLSFGRDERIIVHAEPEKQNTSHHGLTGSTTERTIKQAWRIENRHSKAIKLQVLAAAPISLDDKITIESKYQPTPHSTEWDEQLGTILWQHTLPAQGSARFSASHAVRHAKDVRVRERK